MQERVAGDGQVGGQGIGQALVRPGDDLQAQDGFEVEGEPALHDGLAALRPHPMGRGDEQGDRPLVHPIGHVGGVVPLEGDEAAAHEVVGLLLSGHGRVVGQGEVEGHAAFEEARDLARDLRPHFQRKLAALVAQVGVDGEGGKGAGRARSRRPGAAARPHGSGRAPPRGAGRWP